MILSKWFSSQC